MMDSDHGACTNGIWMSEFLWNKVEVMYLDEDTGEFVIRFNDKGDSVIKAPDIETMQALVDAIEERMKREIAKINREGGVV